MPSKKNSRSLLSRYRRLPRDLYSRKLSVRNRAQRLLTATILIPIIIVSVIYIIHWYTVKSRIISDNRQFEALYSVSPSSEPTQEPVSAPVTNVPDPTTRIATPEPTSQATSTQSPSPTQIVTSEPTIETTVLPVEVNPTTEEIANTAEPLSIAEDELLILSATPNPETLVYAIQTPPPVQDTFTNLLAVNKETVGYLRIGSQISLPVVQRSNDNDYYLTHNLRGEESEGGTLFLDGSNLLVPEDPVLLIYGHNMKNGTMFQPLTCFERPDYIRSNPVIRFDTIYKNKLYMPVAVFTESVDPDADGFVNIRQFSFDETQWELYVLKLEKLSIYNMDIDAKFGDRLLLLVTCEYTHENGRLVVVCRELRGNETEETARQHLANITLK